MHYKGQPITTFTEINLEPKAVAKPLRYVFIRRKTRSDQAYIFAVRESFYDDEREAIYRIKVRQAYEMRTYLHDKQLSIFKNNPTWSDNNLTFQVVVDKTKKMVRFGPIGNLGLMYPQHQGLGIGTYCMTRLIAWTQTHFHDYGVFSGELASNDANTEHKKLKRNAFYTGLGFELQNMSEDMSSGLFSADSVNQLRSKWNRAKVKEINATFLMNSSYRYCKCIKELQQCRTTVDRNIEMYKRCLSSIRRNFIYGLIAGILATWFLVIQF